MKLPGVKKVYWNGFQKRMREFVYYEFLGIKGVATFIDMKN